MVTNEIYIIVRDAIKAAGDQRGIAFEPQHESHYMALAAVVALKKAGYAIEKTVPA